MLRMMDETCSPSFVETETDLEVLLEIIKFSPNPARIRQALLSVAEICNSEIRRWKFADDDVISTLLECLDRHEETILEPSLYALRCAASMHVELRKKIVSNGDVMTICSQFLASWSMSSRIKQLSCSLISALLKENEEGQKLVRETGCMAEIVKLFKNGMLNPSENKTLNLWISATSTLCYCISNPLNGENQKELFELVPLIKNHIEEHKNEKDIFQPVIVCLGLIVANNANNQNELQRCHGIELLAKLLKYWLYGTCGTNKDKEQICTTICNALNASTIDNVVNAEIAGNEGVVEALLDLFQQSWMKSESKNVTLRTIASLIEYSMLNQMKCMDINASTILVKALFVEEEDLHPSINYILSIIGGDFKNERQSVMKRSKTPEPDTQSVDNNRWQQGVNKRLEELEDLCLKLSSLRENQKISRQSETAQDHQVFSDENAHYGKDINSRIKKLKGNNEAGSNWTGIHVVENSLTSGNQNVFLPTKPNNDKPVNNDINYGQHGNNISNGLQHGKRSLKKVYNVYKPDDNSLNVKRATARIVSPYLSKDNQIHVNHQVAGRNEQRDGDRDIEHPDMGLDIQICQNSCVDHRAASRCEHRDRHSEAKQPDMDVANQVCQNNCREHRIASKSKQRLEQPTMDNQGCQHNLRDGSHNHCYHNRLNNMQNKMINTMDDKVLNRNKKSVKQGLCKCRMKNFSKEDPAKVFELSPKKPKIKNKAGSTGFCCRPYGPCSYTSKKYISEERGRSIKTVQHCTPLSQRRFPFKFPQTPRRKSRYRINKFDLGPILYGNCGFDCEQAKKRKCVTKFCIKPTLWEQRRCRSNSSYCCEQKIGSKRCPGNASYCCEDKVDIESNKVPGNASYCCEKMINIKSNKIPGNASYCCKEKVDIESNKVPGNASHCCEKLIFYPRRCPCNAISCANLGKLESKRSNKLSSWHSQRKILSGCFQENVLIDRGESHLSEDTPMTIRGGHQESLIDRSITLSEFRSQQQQHTTAFELESVSGLIAEEAESIVKEKTKQGKCNQITVHHIPETFKHMQSGLVRNAVNNLEVVNEKKQVVNHPIPTDKKKIVEGSMWNHLREEGDVAVKLWQRKATEKESMMKERQEKILEEEIVLRDNQVEQDKVLKEKLLEREKFMKERQKRERERESQRERQNVIKESIMKARNLENFFTQRQIERQRIMEGKQERVLKKSVGKEQEAKDGTQQGIVKKKKRKQRKQRKTRHAASNSSEDQHAMYNEQKKTRHAASNSSEDQHAMYNQQKKTRHAASNISEDQHAMYNQRKKTRHVASNSSEDQHAMYNQQQVNPFNYDRCSEPKSQNGPKVNRLVNRKSPRLRRARVPYSEQEVQNLVQGVRLHGRFWKQILAAYSFHPCRKPVDLKDKYKQMKVNPL